MTKHQKFVFYCGGLNKIGITDQLLYSEYFHVADKTFAKWIKGTSNYTDSAVDVLAKELGLNLAWYYDGVGEMCTMSIEELKEKHERKMHGGEDDFVFSEKIDLLAAGRKTGLQIDTSIDLQQAVELLEKCSDVVIKKAEELEKNENITVKHKAFTRNLISFFLQCAAEQVSKQHDTQDTLRVKDGTN